MAVPACTSLDCTSRGCASLGCASPGCAADRNRQFAASSAGRPHQGARRDRSGFVGIIEIVGIIRIIEIIRIIGIIEIVGVIGIIEIVRPRGRGRHPRSPCQ